jgi:hypothetical protein
LRIDDDLERVVLFRELGRRLRDRRAAVENFLGRRDAKAEEPLTENGYSRFKRKEHMAREWIKAVAMASACLLAASLGGTCAWAMGDELVTGRETITQYLTPAILEMIFPSADKVGEVGGVPPSAAVYKGGRQIGYLFCDLGCHSVSGVLRPTLGPPRRARPWTPHHRRAARPSFRADGEARGA